MPADAGGARPDHRRFESAGAGASLLSGRRSAHAVRAPPRASDRQPHQLAFRQSLSGPLRPLREVLRAPYLRYVDDFALFADERARLDAWRARSETFLARRAVAALGEDAGGPGRRAGGVSRLRAPARRSVAAAGKRTSGASGTGCGVCATAAARVRWHGPTWSSASPRGWRMRRTPTRGGCAARSSGAGGSHRSAAGPGGLTGPCRRVLRGGSWNDNPRNSGRPTANRKRRRQSEQQHRFPCGEHAPTPEPGRSRPRRARPGASRAGHDGPAPPECAGGVTAGARPGPRGDGRRPPVSGWGGTRAKSVAATQPREVGGVGADRR